MDRRRQHSHEESSPSVKPTQSPAPVCKTDIELLLPSASLVNQENKNRFFGGCYVGKTPTGGQSKKGGVGGCARGIRDLAREKKSSRRSPRAASFFPRPRTSAVLDSPIKAALTSEYHLTLA